MTIKFLYLSEFINVDEFIKNEIKERKKESFPYRGSSLYGFRSLNWFEKVRRVDDIVEEIFFKMFNEYLSNYEHSGKHGDCDELEDIDTDKVMRRIQMKIFKHLRWNDLLIQSFYDDRLSEEVLDLKYKRVGS